MKLYLTEILKEANAAGFAQQPDVSFSNVAPGPTAVPATQPMAPQPNQQMGGMMLPGTMNPAMNNIQIAGPKFTPTI